MAAAVLVQAGRSAMSKRASMVTSGGNALGTMPGGTMKNLTAAQRIEQATCKRSQAILSEQMSWDAEALFRKYDAEGTQLLSRGEVTEVLREIGMEKTLGDKFRATAQLAFDAHSADSHFLSLVEFKQMYYSISQWYPTMLPRQTKLHIMVNGCRGLPPADVNGKADPFCTVSVVGKEKTSKSQTRHIEKTLDPYWGEELNDKYGYEDGDTLLFEVYDYDRDIHKGARTQSFEFMGRVQLAASEFHRVGGFDGKLRLQDCQKGFNPLLSLRVTVNTLPQPPPALKIVVKQAKGLPPADANGKSDPFCIIQLADKPQSRSQTKVLNKTLEPIWDQEFGDKYRYEEGDDLLFEVRDYDGKGKPSELLGRCVLENEKFAKPGGFFGGLDLLDTMKGYYPQLIVEVKVRALEVEPDAPPRRSSKKKEEEEDQAQEAADAAAPLAN